MSFLKQWQVWIRWAVTVAALGLILLRVDLRTLGAHIAGAQLHWIAWSATLSIGVVALMGVRWRCVLRACDVRVPFLQTISVTFIGQFFNAFLPGSTGGDVIKACYATRWAPGRKAAPVVSVLYDRVTAILTLLIVTAVVLGIETMNHDELRWLFNRFVFFALFAVIGTAGFAAVAGFSTKRLLTAFNGEHPIQRFCEKHFRSCRLARDPVRHFLAALAVSIPAHLLNVAAAWCVARSVALDATLLQIAVAVAFVNFSSVLPVSVGGHGVREAGFIFIFTLYGVLPSGAAHEAVLAKVLAFSFLFFARSLISSLPGGLCYTIFRREQAGALDAAPRPGLVLH